MPDHTAIEEDAPALELPIALDMPGKVADFLRAAELEPAERTTLDQGVTVRRGQGYTPARHRCPRRAPPAPCPLPAARRRPGDPAVPAQRKARREYKNRVSAFVPMGP